MDLFYHIYNSISSNKPIKVDFDAFVGYTVTMNCRFYAKRNIILSAFAILLIAIFSVLICSGASEVAFASESTFSTVFPTVSYLQSDDPALVAANDDYLIVYDKTASAIFVRGGGDGIGVYEYSLDITGIDDVKAIGNTAFIHAADGCYTVDLADIASKPVKRELPTPQNANYFSSDGTYLYAKSVMGNVSIYDENLNIALGVDDHLYEYAPNDPVFVGKQVLAGENGLLYFFATQRGEPYYIVYDPVTKRETINRHMDCYVTEAYIGDVVYAQLSQAYGHDDARKIVALDKNDGSVLFSSEIAPDSFCAFGDSLFTIEGKKIVTYALQKNDGGEYIGFEQVSTISMAGSDAYHLDAPLDVTRANGKIAVADSYNMRIGFISGKPSMESVKLTSSPLRLTSDGVNVYALCENGTVVKTDGSTVTQSSEAEDAVDIAFLDKLYILKNDGLYASIGGDIYKLADIANGRRISCDKNGSNLYILKDDGISVFGKGGESLAFLPADLSEAKDFAVDYIGNFTVLYADRIVAYANRALSIEPTSQTQFISSVRATANSLHIDGHSLYFTADECLVGRMTVDSVTADEYEPSRYTPDAQGGYKFAKLKNPSFALPADGRVDGMYSAPTETLMMLDDADGLADGFRYALLDGNFFIVYESDFDEVATETSNGDYAANCDTFLYALPGVESTKIEIKQNTRFSLHADCADFENSVWWRVSYNESIYFVKAADCVEYIYIAPEVEKLYGRAKANRVGGLVNIYDQASTDSEMLTQIVDGTKVEIIETLDDFYLVRHDATVGYMLRSEVKIGGLTTVQIIAITLAAFVAVSGICIFIVIEVTKKKEEQRQKEEK